MYKWRTLVYLDQKVSAPGILVFLLPILLLNPDMSS